MSDQRTDRNVEQAFTLWVDQVAPTSPPERLLESTFVRTMGTGQARVYPWDKLLPRRRELSYSGSGFGFGIALLVLLVVLAMAAGFVGGAFQPMASPSPSPSVSPSASPTKTPPAPLPSAISVVAEATIDVPSAIAMVSDGELLWVLAARGRMDRIDPRSEEITDSATFGPETDLYNGLALNEAGLWATDSDDSAVYRLDPATLEVTARIPAGEAPKGVLANADGVWVADVHGGALLRIDQESNKVGEPIMVGPLGPSGPNWLGYGWGSIWTGIPNNRTIVRVDPVTNTVQATIQAPPGFVPCGGIVTANDARQSGPLEQSSAWVTSCDFGQGVVRVDATSNTAVEPISLPGNAYNPTLINGFVWISVDGGGDESGRLVRIEPTTNTIDRVLVPSTNFGGGGDIAVAAGKVWVVDPYHNTVIGLPISAFAP